MVYQFVLHLLIHQKRVILKYLKSWSKIENWLGDKGSNLDKRSQSPLPYH